jgi:hypothetical protein
MQQIIDKYTLELSAHIIEKDSSCEFCHIKWMLVEMKNWGQNMEHRDKLNRWLGFIQGIFYVEDGYTIDEMREHNSE